MRNFLAPTSWYHKAELEARLQNPALKLTVSRLDFAMNLLNQCIHLSPRGYVDKVHP